MEQTLTNKKSKKEYTYATGRRREATARVRLHNTVNDDYMWGDQPVKKGQLLVNKVSIEEYFPGALAKIQYMEPLRITNTIGRYTFTIRVSGGGKQGQLDAAIAGIAKALALHDTEKYRSALKKKGYITRDSRVRERRKVGTGGKARRRKQSPKR